MKEKERERGKEMNLIEFVFLRGCAGGHHRFQFDKESEDNFRSETFKIQKPRTAWTESDMDRRVRSQFSQICIHLSQDFALQVRTQVRDQTWSI